jgi:phosphocarrier protein HPr
MPITQSCFRFEISDSAGLHLRLAAQFAGLASRFQAEIRVFHRDLAANGKSVLDLLILAVLYGERLDLEAHGPDAEEAVAALAELVAGWRDRPAREARSSPVSGPDGS